MNITHTDKTITFTFPRYDTRCNPYVDDSEQHLLGEYPLFTGLIVHNKNGLDEIGFAGTIDMDYKGKPDQVGDFIVKWYGEEEDFRVKCKELDLYIFEMTI